MTHAAGHLLLVEDNPADVEFVLESLRSGGVTGEVDVARDGVEALERLGLAESVAPDPTVTLPQLVILDIKLPRVTGLEVLARMRNCAATARIPVVVFTSSNIARDIAASYQAGANSYVQKPVEFDRFREVVQQLGRYWLTLNEPPTHHAPPGPGDER